MFREPLVLLLSSAIFLLLLYFKISTLTLQEIVGILLAILLIFFNRFIIPNSKNVKVSFRLALLLLSSLFVQIFVFSTGGFRSSFLVLFHFFAISLSFLVNLKSAVSFLIFSLAVLSLGTWLDPNLWAAFLDDPWTAALYGVSFVALIPLYELIVSRYNLKDHVSKLLSQQLKLTSQREKSLLESLSDLVVITDTQFRVLAFNDAVEKTLGLSSSEVLNQPFFNVVFLKDAQGNAASPATISLEQIAKAGMVSTMNNLLLYVKNKVSPEQVNVHIRLLTNLQGKIDQAIFVISGNNVSQSKTRVHDKLQEAILRHRAALEALKSKLQAKGMIDINDLRIRAELLGMVERDLLSALEIEDHGIKPTFVSIDVAELTKNVIQAENSFAEVLKVPLRMDFDQKFLQDAKALLPEGDSHFSPAMVTSAYFTAPVDPKWFDLLIQKLLNIIILLTSAEEAPLAQVFLTYTHDSVVLTFNCKCRNVSSEQELLFTPYYGDMATRTNLHLGSGLEGFMAQTIATLLGMQIEVKPPVTVLAPSNTAPAFGMSIELKIKKGAAFQMHPMPVNSNTSSASQQTPLDKPLQT